MMRAKQPTFWLLHGPNGWCPAGEQGGPARRNGVSVGPQAGIRLAADPAGLLALQAADGSLGGLVLPRGLALDDAGGLYLLVQATAQRPAEIKRFDPATRLFATLPVVAGTGAAARRLCEPRNIAIAGRSLYVADTGNARVQVFDLDSLALRYVWARQWAPADVAAQGGVAYLLDQQHGRVYRHRPGHDALECVVDQPTLASCWERIAIDRAGRIYLLNSAQRRLDIYDATGRAIGTAGEPDAIRDRFAVPALHSDQYGYLSVPAALARLCAPPQPAQLIFDRAGNPASIAPCGPAGAPSYLLTGSWISPPLDSQIYRCQWHRIELELLELPPGTQVIVSTYSDDQVLAHADIPPQLWRTGYCVQGPIQSGDPRSRPELHHEFLVQSREGQYLWLRIELLGDGYATPAVGALRIHYPRESYLGYLPAIYSADDESRWFLERFLSIFQTEWDALEQRIDDIAQYFDPAAVPAGQPLAYLASWLALPLEGSWSSRQQRNLLAAAPQIYPRRGTLAGLTEYLRVYVQNLRGAAASAPIAAPAASPGYPLIIEGFRERQRLILVGLSRSSGMVAAGSRQSADDHAIADRRLPTAKQPPAEFQPAVPGAQGATHPPLWGPAQVGRLQLGVFSREGDVRLVSVGDPARDLFQEYAQRFRVYLPSVWLRSADHERMLRRAIEAEKPAHTRYELCLVEPRLRVGRQSTVGIDTIIGDYPRTYLACGHASDAAPSQIPRGILGYDTVLGGTPAGRGGLGLRPHTRIGIDTRLT